jgi:hypothetical protein
MFDQIMAERGIDVVSFQGDIATVWLQTPDPLGLSRAAPVVAGLTTEQLLFCMNALLGIAACASYSGKSGGAAPR